MSLENPNENTAGQVRLLTALESFTFQVFYKGQRTFRKRLKLKSFCIISTVLIFFPFPNLCPVQVITEIQEHGD